MIRLPTGVLIEENHEGPELRLACAPGDRAPIERWMDEVRALNFPRLLAPLTVRREPAHLRIRYAGTSHPGVPFSEKVAEWRADLPKGLPLAMQIARALLDLSEGLVREGFADAILSPALLRIVPGDPEPLRLIPVPQRGATIAGWAGASPDAWHWLPPESLFGPAQIDPIRVLGASLHHGLTFGLFPETCTPRERFLRAMQGRVGLPSLLHDNARTALPKSREREAGLLVDLVLDCLEPPGSRRFSKPVAMERFEDLERRLAGHRLLKEWGREDLKKLIDEDTTPAHEGPGPGETPGPHPSWEDRAKTERDAGNLTAALESAWNAIQSEGPAQIRLYLDIVQKIATTTPPPRTQAVDAIARLTASVGDRLNEADSLRIAYLRSRYADDAGSDFPLENRTFESRWNEGVAILVRARKLLSEGTAPNQVSRMCKAGRSLFDAMPQGGGASGQHARAYLFLLDGIAHIGAVAAFRDDRFCIDAFHYFAQALVTAGTQEPGLKDSAFRWLRLLGTLARVSPRGDVSSIAGGIDAMLATQVPTSGGMPTGAGPEIPWFDESKIFPT